MINTIDINAKEWFDKVNGNSYFAGTITTNYGLKDEQRFIMPFQYGYGDQYVHEAATVLDSENIISLEKYSNGSRQPLHNYCSEKGIILRKNKMQNCKKAELKAIV